MIKPDQIPDKVVKAAVNAWKKDDQSFRPNAKTIAAAINAWPGVRERYNYGVTIDEIVLPLPKEKSDD